jgi:hypothetical protein
LKSFSFCPEFDFFEKHSKDKNFTSNTMNKAVAKTRTEIHQALLSHFSLLAEFFVGKIPIKD